MSELSLFRRHDSRDRNQKTFLFVLLLPAFYGVMSPPLLALFRVYPDLVITCGFFFQVSPSKVPPRIWEPLKLPQKGF